MLWILAYCVCGYIAARLVGRDQARWSPKCGGVVQDDHDLDTGSLMILAFVGWPIAAILVAFTALAKWLARLSDGRSRH